MTNEEAIELISMIDVCDYEFHVHTHWGSFDDDMKEALQLAIKGLKNLESLEKVKEEIKDLDLGFVDEEYRAGVAYGIMKTTEIINKHTEGLN